MAQSREEIYTGLTESMVIGPEHHQFELRGEPIDCPLGQLWQADDISTNTPLDVSLIVLDPFLLQNKTFLANFKKQIVRAKAINHSHIAEIYGYFIHKGGLLFFAFEPVNGLTLEQLMTTSVKSRLPLKQIQGLLTQLTAAMNLCVRYWRTPFAGIENEFVYVNKRSGVKLLPISMWELFHNLKEMPSTVFYFKKSCSPQVLEDKSIDSSSDSYSLAAIVYQLHGGERFSIGDTHEERKSVEFTKPEDLNDAQWECLQKALSNNPTERFATTVEFVKSFFAEDLSKKPNDEPSDTKDIEDSDSPDENKSISFNLGKKNFNFKLPKFVVPLIILLLGLGTGFILGVISSLNKIDNANENLQRWKEQAITQEELLLKQKEKLDETDAIIKDLEIKNKALDIQLNSSSKSGAEPLSVFRDPLPQGQYGPDMIVLAPTTFTMGDSIGDGNDNEKPVHTVTFERKFALGRYEITFAQYDLFAQQTGRPLPDDEGWGRGSQPVINITWRDARAYTLWLAKETQLPYRLPAEAEWEYAARAGTSTNFWWGNDMRPGYAHCTDCENELSGKQPLPVGSLKANPWGFYDLNGNVDEWVLDCYEDDYLRAHADGRPFQTTSCENKAMRGGSWFDINRITRSSSRYRHPPTAKRNTWGFRVALDIN